MKRSEELIGKYQATGRGFGFLIPEEGEDCFIPPRAQGGAWNGDTVSVRITEEDPQTGRRVAKVTQVLERANKTVVGVLEKHDHALWLRPDSERLPGLIQVVTRRRNLHAGERAAVSMTGFGGDRHPPMGTLKETFGPADQRQSAVAAILYSHDIHRDFPPEVMEQTRAIPQFVQTAAMAGRLDLRDKTIITIDGASSKDFDDAVSLEQDDKGRWVLGVHIADVSHYVQPGTPLDLEAYERGTSVYFADQVVPMLPEALSNGICSLNPQVDRLALSCILTLDREGTVVDHQIAKTVIRSTERMTYGDCNKLLAGEDPALAVKYDHILPMLRDMAILAQVLEARRRRRGGLDLETQESQVLCDENGEPVAVVLRRQGESEKLIEAFMLAANECVAEHLARAGKPCVYRVHEKPSQEKTDALRTLVAPLGYDLKTADGPGLQKLLDWAKGKPEEGAVSLMVLRSLMKARYDGENLGHFGLAAPYYCHFTSPIRRYPDLAIHRILTDLIEEYQPADYIQRRYRVFTVRAAAHSSETELAAMDVERSCEDCYKAEYMQDRVGEVFDATSSGVASYGFYVALENTVEGLVHLTALPEGQYLCDDIALTNTVSGRRYRIGDHLRVKCLAADVSGGKIDFGLETAQ